MKSNYRKLVGLAALAAAAFATLGPASAADLRYTKAPASVAAYNWTGCYIGVEGGGNWGQSQHYQNNPANPNNFGLAQTNGIDLSGGMAGGTVGCNYQFSNIVIGIENDISWTNKSGSAPLILPFNTTETASTRERWIDTLRGRLGVAFDRVLVYGTGGVAFADESFQLVDPVTGFGGYSKTVTGWTAGAGVEYIFWDNWSAKVEYLHADFGKTAYAFAPNSTGLGAGGFIARNVSLTDDMVRVGVNYKFGWGGPVVARY